MFLLIPLTFMHINNLHNVIIHFYSCLHFWTSKCFIKGWQNFCIMHAKSKLKECRHFVLSAMTNGKIGRRVASQNSIICSSHCNYESSNVSSRHKHRKYWLRAANSGNGLGEPMSSDSDTHLCHPTMDTVELHL